MSPSTHSGLRLGQAEESGGAAVAKWNGILESLIPGEMNDSEEDLAWLLLIANTLAKVLWMFIGTRYANERAHWSSSSNIQEPDQ